MKVESPSVTIVLVGSFSPDDFTPDKLAQGKVLATKVAASASYITLIPSHHVQLKLAWGELSVSKDRFQISTTETPYIRACDFALKALGDFAPNASVFAFGINRDAHYDLGSVEARNNLGIRLAPPEAWGAWGKTLLEDMDRAQRGMSLQSAGLLYLQMRQYFRDEAISGWLDVSVTPSAVMPTTGVLFRSNHHHQLSDSASESGDLIKAPSESDITNRLLENLSARFDNSITQVESILEGVITS
jgi:hypothetical protein